MKRAVTEKKTMLAREKVEVRGRICKTKRIKKKLEKVRENEDEGMKVPDSLIYLYSQRSSARAPETDRWASL